MTTNNNQKSLFLDMEDEATLRQIEFSVESRMNLESEETCTIIASAEVIKGIKIAIAKGLIFKDIYNRLVFQENPEPENPYEIVIVPDSIIDEVVQDEIKTYLANNADVQEKMAKLNDILANVDEAQLTKISTSKESELSEEELELKKTIQDGMINVGMNVDLVFSAKDNESAKVDDIFKKIADQNCTVNLKGATNERQ